MSTETETKPKRARRVMPLVENRPKNTVLAPSVPPKRFRVVSHSLSTPRHACSFEISSYQSYVVEIITKSEWPLLTRAERPSRYTHVPGVGYVTLRTASERESAEVCAENRRQILEWKTLRGIEVF